MGARGETLGCSGCRGSCCSLTIRWLVTQVRQPSSGGCRALGRTVGPQGSAGRPVRDDPRQWKYVSGNPILHYSGPLRIAKSLPEENGASRRETLRPQQNMGRDRNETVVVDVWVVRPRAKDACGCGRRIGVVKLLRARGGCLGVISNTGVEGCDKSGGAAERALIPGIPEETRGTETSQYPEERKSTETPSVAASERGQA